MIRPERKITGKAADQPSGLRILPLGGLGEIGMNCMIIEWEDEMIVVDCGIHFSDLDHFGVEFIIPDFSYLVERKDKLAAFVFTHGHEDHIGALPLALRAGVNAPIYGSDFTIRLVQERLREYGYLDRVELRPFKMGDQFKFKRFGIETVSVNHSIVDAAALVIDTPVGKIVHTGDFKIDPMPHYGSTLDEKKFREVGDQGVLLLMSDSTNVERTSESITEKVIYERFDHLLTNRDGLTLVSVFASNIARMGQVFEIAAKHGKKVALAGRSMEQNVRLGVDAGYLEHAPSTLIDLSDIESYPRKDIVVLSTGSQGEYRSALARVAAAEHAHIKLQQGDLVVLSSKFIPGNEKAIGRMINHLFMQGAEVLYEQIHDIHTSGHATRPELKRMLEWIKPRYFMPVHGEYRHLVHHSALAREVGLGDEQIITGVNGDVIELDENRFEIVDHLEEGRILVEGRDGKDISRIVLKERRQLGEKGIVFSMLVRNAESGRILSEPEIVARGLADETVQAWLMDEARKIVRKVISQYEKSLYENGPRMDLQETIRIELRRFFNQNIGKKPTVMPIVLDL